MFGATNPFGQSSNSPFASQSVFGQTNNATSTPFEPKPFGSPTPFGSQTGGSSTGVFGAAQSSPFSSTTVFGASSSPAFGSSMTAFGSSSTPSFGSSSSSFGGSSVFRQKPAFGFGSTPTQSSPFGIITQQSQPAFGSGKFGSLMPFVSTQPAFGAASTPAFGAASTPAFGASSTPAFGSTSTLGAFGASSTPAFGGSSSAFGGSSTPAFGASSTPSFSFGSSPTFGQSMPAFGSSPLGTTTIGAQSSPFATQTSAPAFGQSTFGVQRGGSRAAPYTSTTEADSGSGTQPAGKLESKSAMPIYKDKSHEELRWEDYQLGDKGGSQPAAQPSGGIGFGVSTTPTSPFGPSSTFGQTSSNPFSSASANPFSLKPPSFNSTGFTTSTTTSNLFQSTSSSLFGPTSSTTTSIFSSSSTPTFGTGSSLFSSSVTPSFSTSPSIFGTAAASATTPAFATGLNFSSSQTSPLFNSTPAIGQAGNTFGQGTSTFGQNTSNIDQTGIFNTTSTGFSGNMFSSSLSLAPSRNPAAFGPTTPSFASPFQPAQPAPTSGTFSFSNFGQSQSGGGAGIFGQSNTGSSHLPPTQTAAVVQPVAITNPYGTLPAVPQMSIGRAGTAPSVQYGISSMPVVEKHAPVRISPLLTSQYLSQRRIRLPARKYHPNTDSPKVPFFSDDEEAPSTPKADAVFIPRENPRALVIRPTENWPSGASAGKAPPLKDVSAPVHENENPAENGLVEEQIHPVRGNQKANGVRDDHPVQKESSCKTLSGHRAGEAAIVYEYGADIEALMPKLRRSDYYTEPRIQELAAKERAEPGYCRRVNDFVVGRHGYGSIKFLGETDVRRLDLESLVQFNNREVVVYMDDSKKPPVGQGLNKPAEVTLLNIKCFDKKTGRQCSDGPKVEKYKDMLKTKGEDQGAEFLSYDPIEGEWKFRVNHFSIYKLEDEKQDSSQMSAIPDR